MIRYEFTKIAWGIIYTYPDLQYENKESKEKEKIKLTISKKYITYIYVNKKNI